MLSEDRVEEYLYATGNEKQSRGDTLSQNVLSESQLAGGYHGIRHAAGARKIGSINEGEGHVPPIVRPDIKLSNRRAAADHWQELRYPSPLTPPNTPTKQQRTPVKPEEHTGQGNSAIASSHLQLVYQDSAESTERHTERVDSDAMRLPSDPSGLQSPSVTSQSFGGRQESSSRRSPSLVFSVQLGDSVGEEEMRRKREYLQKLISEALDKESQPASEQTEELRLLEPPKTKLKRQLSVGSADSNDNKAIKRVQCTNHLNPVPSSPSLKSYPYEQFHHLRINADISSESTRGVKGRPSTLGSYQSGSNNLDQGPPFCNVETSDNCVYVPRNGSHPSCPQLSPSSREVDSILRTDALEIDRGLSVPHEYPSNRQSFMERTRDSVGPAFSGMERHEFHSASVQNPWVNEERHDVTAYQQSNDANTVFNGHLRHRFVGNHGRQQTSAIPENIALELISRGILSPQEVCNINRTAIDDRLDQQGLSPEPKYHVIMIPADKVSPMTTYREPPRSPYKLGRFTDRRDPPMSPYKTARSSERCEGTFFTYDNFREQMPPRSPPSSPRSFHERCRSECPAYYSRSEVTNRTTARERCGMLGDNAGHISSKVKELTEALRQLDHNDKECTCSKVEDEILRMARDAYKKIRRKGDSPKALREFELELQETNSGICEAMRVLCSIKSLCKYGRTLEDVDVSD